MENIFSDMQIGTWSIEIREDSVPRMYGDEVFLKLVEVEKNMSPEELYCSWYNKVKGEYLEYVNNAVERILSGKQVEVEYVWRNSKNQETFVRCCGKLDEEFKDGLRIKGYHQNIDKIVDSVNLDIKNDKNYEVKDYFKFLRYATFFYELYDECYEIDLETYKIVTIFNKKHKYNPISENNLIFDETNNNVHPEDRITFNSLFNRERLKKLEENNQSENMDIRIKNIHGKYVWVRLKALVTTFAESKKLVFYLYDIEDEKRLEEIIREKDDIVEALVDVDSAIMDVNLESGEMKILRFSKELNRNIKIDTTLRKLCEKLLKYYIQENDSKEIYEFFSINNLRMLADKKIDKSIEVKLKDDEGQYRWTRICNLSLSSTSDRIFILIKNIDGNHLAKNIIEKFVYSNCDYLLYVDLKNNKYIKISGSDEDTTILDRDGNNYVEKTISYIDKYAIPEEKERLKRIIQPEYILEVLDKKESLDFTTAIIDEKGNYRRKYVLYQYYDKENKIVLVQRKDVTSSYFSLREQSERLERAEKESMTDYLTGIYNRKGCELKIKECISRKNLKEKSAFLLFDLDNFKKLNDSFGHKVGDEVLQKIAKILKDSFRISDVVGRLGGDEFIVFMTNIKDKDGLTQKLKSLLKKLEFEYGFENKKIRITSSIGIAWVENDDFTFDKLYLQADQALYRAKENGRNNFVFY